MTTKQLCEFCDGLGAALTSDVNEVALKEKNLYQDKLIPYEYGEDDFRLLAYENNVIVCDQTGELMIVCPWCDGFGKASNE